MKYPATQLQKQAMREFKKNIYALIEAKTGRLERPEHDYYHGEACGQHTYRGYIRFDELFRKFPNLFDNYLLKELDATLSDTFSPGLVESFELVNVGTRPGYFVVTFSPDVADPETEINTQIRDEPFDLEAHLAQIDADLARDLEALG